MPRKPDPAVRERWLRLIELQRDSNLTVADFCRQREISQASFYRWRQKLGCASSSGNSSGSKSKRQRASSARATFVQVKLTSRSTAAAVTKVRFVCGAELELEPSDHASASHRA